MGFLAVFGVILDKFYWNSEHFFADFLLIFQ